MIDSPKRGKPTQLGKPVDAEVDDPYNTDGYRHNIELEEQITERVKRAADKLVRAVDAKQKKLKRPLTDLEKGRIIRKVIFNEVRPGKTKFSKRNNSAISQMSKSDLNEKVARASREKWDTNKKLKIRAITGDELIKIYNIGILFISERLFQKALKHGFPKVFFSPRKSGEWKPSYYSEMLNVIVLTTKRPGVIRHEFTHFLDMVGQNGIAAVDYRDRFTFGPFVELPGGGSGYQGKWAEPYCGRVYEDTKTANEFVSMAHQMLTSGREKTLAMYWNVNLEQIAFLLAYLEGQFV
jgi:hypothetical protein